MCVCLGRDTDHIITVFHKQTGLRIAPARVLEEKKQATAWLQASAEKFQALGSVSRPVIRFRPRLLGSTNQALEREVLAARALLKGQSFVRDSEPLCVCVCLSVCWSVSVKACVDVINRSQKKKRKKLSKGGWGMGARARNKDKQLCPPRHPETRFKMLPRAAEGG